MTNVDWLLVIWLVAMQAFFKSHFWQVNIWLDALKHHEK